MATASPTRALREVTVRSKRTSTRVPAGIVAAKRGVANRSTTRANERSRRERGFVVIGVVHLRAFAGQTMQKQSLQAYTLWMGCGVEQRVELCLEAAGRDSTCVTRYKTPTGDVRREARR